MNVCGFGGYRLHAVSAVESATAPTQKEKSPLCLKSGVFDVDKVVFLSQHIVPKHAFLTFICRQVSHYKNICDAKTVLI